MEFALRFFERALLLVFAVACLVGAFRQRGGRKTGEKAGSWVLSILLIVGVIVFLGLFIHLTVGR
ncbi:MAG: hypothetical protein ACR2JE_02535 [Acidobacteriaceae bacterium]